MPATFSDPRSPHPGQHVIDYSGLQGPQKLGNSPAAPRITPLSHRDPKAQLRGTSLSPVSALRWDAGQAPELLAGPLTTAAPALHSLVELVRPVAAVSSQHWAALHAKPWTDPLVARSPVSTCVCGPCGAGAWCTRSPIYLKCAHSSHGGLSWT